MTEQLTDEERAALDEAQDQELADPWFGCKAIRIIDAHAADRAALVAQVVELTRERDEARADAMRAWDANDALRAEVTRLTEALAAAERLASSRLKSFTDAYESNRYLKATVADKEIAFDIASKRADAADARVRALSERVSELEERAQRNFDALVKVEALAAEWQQTARDAQADLAVLRTEHEKLKARVEQACSALAEAHPDSQAVLLTMRVLRG